MNILKQALSDVGVVPNINSAIGAAIGASKSLTKAINDFQADQAGKPMYGPIRDLNNAIKNSIPPIFKSPNNQTGPNIPSKSGEWTAIHYADDLVAHHPKFKFLFKVKFEGFGDGTFYHYVHRCDKPNITLNHTEVNYYNFRTKVLTHVTFQPMTITFLDEIGNSVNDFFVKYMSSVSGQANGKWGIDNGFSSASSSLPYKRGYSNGKSITVEQIFANGLYVNQFKFINPRIETFQFDELNMEDNAGSLATIMFNYDSLQSNTYTIAEDNDSELYTWGNTDILKSGGTSGVPNAGGTSLSEGGKPRQTSANGGSIIDGLGRIKSSNDVYTVVTEGVNQANSLPSSLQRNIETDLQRSSRQTGLDSGSSTLDRNIQDSIKATQTDLQRSQIDNQTRTNQNIPEYTNLIQPDYVNAPWIKLTNSNGIIISTTPEQKVGIKPFPNIDG